MKQTHAEALAQKRARSQLVYRRNKKNNVCVQTGCARRGRMPLSPYCAKCRKRGNLYTKAAKRKARKKAAA